MHCLVARFDGRSIRYPLPHNEVKLGSGSESEILIPFPGVSRSHAVLIPTSDGIVLRDAGSKNHVYVGKERVEEVTLLPGIDVQVGRATLTLEDAATSDVELALTVPKSPAEASGSGTCERSDRESAASIAAGLRVVRGLVRASRKGLREQVQSWISSTREVIGASSVVLLSIEGKTEYLIATAGNLLSEPLIRQIALAVQLDRIARDSVLRVLLGHMILTCRTRGNRNLTCLAAVFPAAQTDVEPWQRDVFDLVASRLLDLDGSESGEGQIERTASLRLPTNMVSGESTAIQKLLTEIQSAMHSRMDVLLSGETGTGKELFARMIHASGPTATGPFVAINCAAIPSELLESELFGVQGRVATGVDPRPGLFVQADGGSIFLDEIGELAEMLQAKLLRVLQEREVLPLGASAPRKINVRVIASSNRNLLERTEEGRFRADLYYRLRGLEFHIPPLRERREDIPSLVLAFVARVSESHRKRVRGVSRKALRLLMEHDWPGNVRELQSEIERAVLICYRGGALQIEHFPSVSWAITRKRGAAAATQTAAPQTPSAASPPSLRNRVDALERTAIEEALRATDGNKSLAARILGITRNGLAIKLRRLGLRD